MLILATLPLLLLPLMFVACIAVVRHQEAAVQWNAAIARQRSLAAFRAECDAAEGFSLPPETTRPICRLPS